MWRSKVRSGLLADPLPFLWRFAVLAGGLFLLRQPLASAYLSVLTPVVNAVYAHEGLPVQYLQSGGALSLLYLEPGARFQVHDVVYQNLLTMAALFGATPGYEWRWRIKWLGGAAILLWVTHVLMLYMGGYVIIWDYALGLPAAQRRMLIAQLPAALSSQRDAWFSQVFGLWHSWGRQTLGLVIWVVAARGYLGIADSPEQRQARVGTRAQ